MMKLCVLVLAIAAFVAAAPLEDEAKISRFIEFPGGDGVMHTVDLEKNPDHDVLTEVARNPANNRYFLFTRNNPDVSQELIFNDIRSISGSNFDADKPIIVVVHGWLGSVTADLNPAIRDAALANDDVNVIIFDWRRLALTDYVTASFGIPAVGRGLGQFLEWLSSITGAPISNVHLVGFSLGAHLVGNAGRQLGGQAARVTGLDPPGPLWSYNSDRLSDTDGVYVEVMHTTGGVLGLGIGTAIGNADFYPNGGTSTQPGCITAYCDHNRAWELFAATVEFNHLIARQCANSIQVTWDLCRGDELAMGNNDLTKWGTGSYRVNTARRHPF